MLRLAPLNRVYERNKHLQGVAFLEALLQEFNVHYDVREEDLKKIPKEGPFITISNHPLGGLDGILLLRLLLEQRPDYKVMANFLLARIAPLDPYIIQVNPFEDHKDASSSLMGFKQALAHLKEGKPLRIFLLLLLLLSQLELPFVNNYYLLELNYKKSDPMGTP